MIRSGLWGATMGVSMVLGGQLVAQEEDVPRSALSTRATVEVTLNGRMISGQWSTTAPAIAGPARIAIDYGQPHRRNREIIGGLVPYDQVWRTGANEASHFETDVDLTLGGAFVPRGLYSLFTLPSEDGWKLILNRQTYQWGEDYDPQLDVARIDLESRTLPEPLESFTVWLIPERDVEPGEPARGVLRLAWENVESSTTWRVGR